MGSCGEYNWTLHKTWLQLDAQNLVAEGGTMYSRPVALFAATCAVLFFVVGVPGALWAAGGVELDEIRLSPPNPILQIKVANIQGVVKHVKSK